MRNIRAIIKGDARRIGSSVVAIVIIMGLCIVPVLYAWFNIFSNWDPYGVDSTSRIKVSVASADKGADILGLELNVGDQMLEALAANDQIGWVFVDSKEEALQKVYSGECYAALIVPEDFSKDIVSFMSLEFKHPQLLYYENGKKNAIAPKITGQAKTSVQKQVNATFLETIVGDVAEVVKILEANGLDAEATLENLSNTLNELSDKLEGANTTLNSLVNLTDACRSLLLASSQLVTDMSTSIGLTGELAGNISSDIAATGSNIRESIAAVVSALQGVNSNLGTLYSDISTLLSEPSVYNDFLNTDLASRAELTRAMEENARTIAQTCADLGLNNMAWQMNSAADRIGAFAGILEGLTPVDPEDNETWAAIQERLLEAMEHLNSARDAVNNAVQEGSSAIGEAIENRLNNVSASIGNVQELLANFQGRTANVAGDLNNLAASMGTLESGVLTTMSAVNKARTQLKEVADFVDALAHSEFLQELIAVLDQGGEALNDRIASPLRVSDEIMYPTGGSYGSQMSPFYTVLAQWVGALFSAVLLKTRMREEELEEMERKLTMPQHFIGRFGIFFFVAVMQALITSLGDLWYVGIVCGHPGLFVLAAVVTSLCFTMINYMLVFTLGAAGLAVSVIVMVLQVAGAGGTYPIEVVPRLFQMLYPYMPFKFAMNAMREAVSGLYGNVYWWNIEILALIFLGCIPVGFLIYRPAKLLNDILEKAKADTGIML